ncbi:MAG: hypothetical protein HQ591_08310 [candidate division Zixibacteria bacterium]|nr:hypothetical protein [Candidatus Tariuqbacter arcticus]
MKEKSVVGDLINFRGLVYSPMNENGVIFVFGKVIEDLNMYIEEIKPGFPDCVGRRFTGKGWERVYIEFEHKSSNFVGHRHDLKGCDIIVCWEHDWVECPLEVIELREVIKELPSEPIKRPNVEKEEYVIEDLYRMKKVKDNTRNLFQRFDKAVKSISDEIWSKVGKSTVSYYSPERVFLYTNFRQKSIRFDIFTRGETIDDVSNYDFDKGGEKWGQISLATDEELLKVLEAVKRSYQLIKEAIKNNETTGWFAKTVEEIEEDTD